ncbi:MAG: MFS transporter [Candidatus Caldarchaeum sp.]
MTGKQLSVAVGMAGFSLLGWSVASISTSLPKIINEYSISYDVAGLLAGAMPMGGIIGFATGILSDALGYSKTVCLALLIFLLGLGLAPFPSSIAIIFAGFIIIGVGSVLLVSSASPLIASAYPTKSGTMLNYMYAGWGFGIGLGSVATAFLAETNWRLSFLIPIPVVFAIFLTALRRLQDFKHPNQRAPRLADLVRNIPVVVPSLFIVGVELGFATWLPSLLSLRYSGIGIGLAVTIFSVSMGLGRALLGRIGDHLGAVRSITLLGGIAGMMFTLFTVVDNFTAKLSILPFIGLAVGPLLPTFTAWVITLNPTQGGSSSGFVISTGRVGTFFINWLVGLALGFYGEFTAMSVFVISCVVMVVYLNMLVKVGGIGLRRG